MVALFELALKAYVEDVTTEVRNGDHQTFFATKAGVAKALTQCPCPRSGCIFRRGIAHMPRVVRLKGG